MAPRSPTTRSIPHDGDELDDLFNYDATMDDAFNSLDTDKTVTGRQELNNRPNANGEKEGLGIDEEIKIVKKRQPIAKLDETRLLSAAGIPKLRRISKDRLKFKGKGHEFSDVARLLNMYQLWLDDLYPRAKFADGLAIIEKLGHSKRIQMMRREWIEEGKPKATEEIDPEENNQAEEEDSTTSRREADIEHNSPMERTSAETVSEIPVPGDVAETIEGPTSSDAGAGPDDDELDALLAEESALGPPGNNSLISGAAIPSRPPKPTAAQDDEFADDLDAMAEMDGLW
ncbi:Swi3-domain-containing protein [Glonium stellatum]|uniref:Chromosome segregation in meiosis protein n=1 Tax=Glonium stellatum TaxID=574774 RepID=A0A8E2EZG8_9PEZI|nr:Swi3-domain-containing protein [Glonium stellatum]